MNDSILNSIKKLLGIDNQYEHFDQDIILAINTELNVLNQLGVGPEEGFKIEDSDSKWSDFVGDRKDLEMIKTAVHMRTKLLFDPPQNSFLVDILNKQLAEIEWRIDAQQIAAKKEDE